MKTFLEQATFLARGAEILPAGVGELAKRLQKAHEKQKPLRIKLGLDPTRPDLHLGHSVVIRKLKQFQDAGHQVVLIVGGATAMIGDPSGKSETRPALTKAEVEENAKTYFEQVGKIIDIEKAEIVNNSDWLHDMKLADLLKLSSNVTVAQMLARDDFSKRYSEGKPISVHEFFYPLAQAYDSVMVEADIELGGTDQRFNNLLGREIQQAYSKKPQMVMLLPLLEGTDGVIKMSKSHAEHCISLTEQPNNMYGKLMSIPDSLIIRYFELLTDIPSEEIQNYKIKMEQGENPRNYKMKLAKLIVAEYHCELDAQGAEEFFISTVQRKQLPDEIPDFKVDGSESLVDFMVNNNLLPSKGEAKRLIKGGGVKIEGEKIVDIAQSIDFKGKTEIILQFGKRKFAKLKK